MSMQDYRPLPEPEHHCDWCGKRLEGDGPFNRVVITPLRYRLPLRWCSERCRDKYDAALGRPPFEVVGTVVVSV